MTDPLVHRTHLELSLAFWCARLDRATDIADTLVAATQIQSLRRELAALDGASESIGAESALAAACEDDHEWYDDGVIEQELNF